MEREQKAADEARKLAEQQRIEDATRTQSKKTEDMKKYRGRNRKIGIN